jgi:hypothetical protein
MALMMDPDFRAHDFGMMAVCKSANYDLILHLARHITRKEHMSSFFERITEYAEIGSQRGSYSGLYAATACLNGDVEEMIKWFPENRLQLRHLQLLSIYDPTGNSMAYFADRDPEFLSNYSYHKQQPFSLRAIAVGPYFPQL